MHGTVDDSPSADTRPHASDSRHGLRECQGSGALWNAGRRRAGAKVTILVTGLDVRILTVTERFSADLRLVQPAKGCLLVHDVSRHTSTMSCDTTWAGAGNRTRSTSLGNSMALRGHRLRIG